MRKELYLLLVFVYAVITNGAKCIKDVPVVVPVLPAITQTGANTFGCKIDGKLWVPYWPCADLTAGTVEFQYNIQPINQGQVLPLFLSISAGLKTDGSLFLFQQGYNLADHIYGVGNIIDSMGIHFFSNDQNDYQNYTPVPGDTAAHYLQITKLDTINNIISGVFAFKLYGGHDDSVVVTDGRFDLQIGSFRRCTH